MGPLSPMGRGRSYTDIVMPATQRQLTDSQVREVLARAEEIHLGGSATSDSILRAAEEAGLPREAVEQALRERFQHLERPPSSGELVFAKSGDDYFYVAKVLEPLERGARVSFLAGGEHESALEELRHAPFTPGQRVTVNWPGFGWSPARITYYDAETGRVTVRGWAATETVSLADVRIEPLREERVVPRGINLGFVYGLVVGGAVTALVAWWISR